MPKQLYLLDTVNATRNYDKIMEEYLEHPYHSYNVLFPFKFPLRNLRTITLKSVEMPILQHTLKVLNDSHRIAFRFTSGSYVNTYVEVTVTSKQYSSASELLTLINSQLAGSLSVYGVSISLSEEPASYFSPLCKITHTCTSITLISTILSFHILGYTNKFTAGSGFSLLSNSPINLNVIDTCLYMRITNLPIMNNNTKPFTFKIPINGFNVSNGILFHNENYDNQTIYFNDSNFILDKLNIVVCDRFGVDIIGYYNWSSSLLIENDDDNNNNTIEFLNIYN